MPSWQSQRAVAPLTAPTTEALAGAVVAQSIAMVSRSIVVGLLGALLYMLADWPRHPSCVVQPAAPAASAGDMTVVDVAAGIRGATVAGLVVTDRGEQIVRVDGQPVDGWYQAGAAIAERATGRRGYIDIEIASSDAQLRRVLVLMH